MRSHLHVLLIIICQHVNTKPLVAPVSQQLGLCKLLHPWCPTDPVGGELKGTQGTDNAGLESDYAGLGQAAVCFA